MGESLNIKNSIELENCHQLKCLKFTSTPLGHYHAPFGFTTKLWFIVSISNKPFIFFDVLASSLDSQLKDCYAKSLACINDHLHMVCVHHHKPNHILFSDNHVWLFLWPFFFLLLGVLMFVSMILYVILSMTTRPPKKSLYMFLGHKFCMGDH